MSFDFERFLKQNQVEYVDVGSNVARGNINIQCPFCGPSDPSHHMGINIITGYWGCWRNKQHRGRQPQRLVMKLLGCSSTRAMAIVGTGPAPEIGAFDDAIADLKKGEVPVAAVQPIGLLPHFKPITWAGFGGRFARYLLRRGFKGNDIDALVDYYLLHYSLMGHWHNRVIIPVYENGMLVTWTGRTINRDVEVRYRTLTMDPEKASKFGDPLAAKNIKDVVYNYDRLIDGGKALFVTEGPFDAIKVDWYGKAEGCRATCLFSLDLRQEQKYALAELAKGFDHKFILFDADARAAGAHLEVLQALTPFGYKDAKLPSGKGDPGKLSERGVYKLLDLHL